MVSSLIQSLQMNISVAIADNVLLVATVMNIILNRSSGMIVATTDEVWRKGVKLIEQVALGPCKCSHAKQHGEFIRHFHDEGCSKGNAQEWLDKYDIEENEEHG